MPDADIRWNTGALEELLNSPGGPVAAYLGRVGMMVESRAKQNLTEYDAIDLGRLRGSITHVVASEGSGLAVYVGTNVEYALPVHNGRRAGAKMPPEEPIRDWMRHKRIGGGETESAQRSIAFLIRRKIARDGINPRPYLANAIDAARGVT